ncbi:MAG: hypothetical protein PHE27_04340 [Alphaproteobacteria bacterium]|nr:hypothetical protein [Alphaproteobacteria bacterium]
MGCATTTYLNERLAKDAVIKFGQPVAGCGDLGPTKEFCLYQNANMTVGNSKGGPTVDATLQNNM